VSPTCTIAETCTMNWSNVLPQRRACVMLCYRLSSPSLATSETKTENPLPPRGLKGRICVKLLEHRRIITCERNFVADGRRWSCFVETEDHWNTQWLAQAQRGGSDEALGFWGTG